MEAPPSPSRLRRPGRPARGLTAPGRWYGPGHGRGRPGPSPHSASEGRRAGPGAAARPARGERRPARRPPSPITCHLCDRPIDVTCEEVVHIRIALREVQQPGARTGDASLNNSNDAGAALGEDLPVQRGIESTQPTIRTTRNVPVSVLAALGVSLSIRHHWAHRLTIQATTLGPRFPPNQNSSLTRAQLPHQSWQQRAHRLQRATPPVSAWLTSFAP